MTVTAYPKDVLGVNLQTKVTNAQTTLNGISSASTGAKATATAALDQAQRELVEHYLSVGRLTAANILSTMT